MVLDYCPPLRISRVRLLKDMKIITQVCFVFFILQELYTEDHVECRYYLGIMAFLVHNG